MSDKQIRIGMIAKAERKNTICPAGTCPDALMQDAMARKNRTDAIFMAMPTMGRASPDATDETGPAMAYYRLAIMSAGIAIASQMRSGVAGISISSIPSPQRAYLLPSIF